MATPSVMKRKFKLSLSDDWQSLQHLLKNVDILKSKFVCNEQKEIITIQFRI